MKELVKLLKQELGIIVYLPKEGHVNTHSKRQEDMRWMTSTILPFALANDPDVLFMAEFKVTNIIPVCQLNTTLVNNVAPILGYPHGGFEIEMAAVLGVVVDTQPIKENYYPATAMVSISPIERFQRFQLLCNGISFTLPTAYNVLAHQLHTIIPVPDQFKPKVKSKKKDQ